MPEFYTLIDPQNAAVDFKVAVIALLDAMMNTVSVTGEQKAQLARLRARVQIDLTEF